MPQSTRTLTHEIFWGSVLYVDHMSDFMYNHLITGITSMETLKSKQAYERVANSYGVQVKSYHADNLRFNKKNFSGYLLKGGQTITFCGVGAHHQNDVVESKIKEVCYGGGQSYFTLRGSGQQLYQPSYGRMQYRKLWKGTINCHLIRMERAH